MTIEEALYTYLTGYASLSALIGTKLYPLVIPEDIALPAVTYQRISTPSTARSHGGNCLLRPRFQFACVAATAELAREVAAQVRAALDNYSGMMGGAGGVDVVSFVDNQFENFASPSDGYVVRLDAVIWHQG